MLRSRFVVRALPALGAAIVVAAFFSIWLLRGASRRLLDQDRVYVRVIDPVTEIEGGYWDESVWIPGLEFLLEGLGWALLTALTLAVARRMLIRDRSTEPREKKV